MKLVSDGKYITVSEKKLKSKLGLLSYRQARGSLIVRIEDCLVNRLAISDIVLEPTEVVSTKHETDYFSSFDYTELITTSSKLREYQISDIISMARIGNVLNRNPMGTGKTVEAVVLMRCLKVKSAIIVAPKSVVYQWKQAIEEWYPDVADRVLVNSNNPKSGKILIYNYEKLARNSKLLERVCSLGVWDIHICDEAHRIKNRKSKRTIAIKSIPSKRRVALTGTPWTNKPDDLWSLLNWLDPFYAGKSYWNFTNYFCNIKQTPWGQSISGLTQDQSRVLRLKRLLGMVSVYNPVSVSEGKTIITVKLEMEKAQSILFNQAKKLILDELPERLTIANGAVLATRLQQVSSWPALFDDEKRKKSYGPGIKFEWIRDFIEDNPLEKVVVFTRFAETAKALQKYLSGNCVLYIGEMNSGQRDAAKRIFIEDPDIRVLVGTIGAMGEGVDGLQYASRTMICIDRDWSPTVMEQCEDRINRSGQEYPVICYYLECSKSFDQHVGKINLSKADSIRAVLEVD